MPVQRSLYIKKSARITLLARCSCAFLFVCLLVGHKDVSVVNTTAVNNLNLEVTCPDGVPANVAVVGVVGVAYYEVTVLVVNIKVEVGITVADNSNFGESATNETDVINVGTVGQYSLVSALGAAYCTTMALRTL